MRSSIGNLALRLCSNGRPIGVSSRAGTAGKAGRSGKSAHVRNIGTAHCAAAAKAQRPPPVTASTRPPTGSPSPRTPRRWPNQRFAVRRPERSAVCGNAARTNLNGRRPAIIGLPTTTEPGTRPPARLQLFTSRPQPQQRQPRSLRSPTQRGTRLLCTMMPLRRRERRSCRPPNTGPRRVQVCARRPSG